MHRVSIFFFPTATPFKSMRLKYTNDVGIHIASCPRRICMRIEINSYTPAVRGKMRLIVFITVHITATIRLNMPMQIFFVYDLEYLSKS